MSMYNAVSPPAHDVAEGVNRMSTIGLGTSALFALFASARQHTWLDGWHEILASLTALGAFLGGAAAAGQFVRGLIKDGVLRRWRNRMHGWVVAMKQRAAVRQHRKQHEGKA